jgi:hypothetical protein
VLLRGSREKKESAGVLTLGALASGLVFAVQRKTFRTGRSYPDSTESEGWERLPSLPSPAERLAGAGCGRR